MLQRIIKRRNSHRSAVRSPLDEGLGITIRFAYPDDDAALRRLAALDSQLLPPGPLLVAEVAGELWAAVSVTGAPRAGRASHNTSPRRSMRSAAADLPPHLMSLPSVSSIRLRSAPGPPR